MLPISKKKKGSEVKWRPRPFLPRDRRVVNIVFLAWSAKNEWRNFFFFVLLKPIMLSKNIGSSWQDQGCCWQILTSWQMCLLSQEPIFRLYGQRIVNTSFGGQAGKVNLTSRGLNKLTLGFFFSGFEAPFHRHFGRSRFLSTFTSFNRPRKPSIDSISWAAEADKRNSSIQ